MKVEAKSYSFRDALYNAECSVCGANLEWEASFDADGTNYYAKCCDKSYSMFPETVQIEIDPA